MKAFDKLYKELVGQIDRIYYKFIDNYIPADPGIKPEQYEDDVKAYCILAHALVEDYLENISLTIMYESINNWLYNGRINNSLLTLIGCSKFRIDINKLDYKQRSFDNIRLMLEEVKELYSSEIKSNHGASQKYLKKMFVPLAIDIINDENIMNSLNQLSKARGKYAHKRTKSVISPEDAKNYVQDCLLLCYYIKEQAIIKCYENEYKKVLVSKLINIISNRKDFLGTIN